MTHFSVPPLVLSDMAFSLAGYYSGLYVSQHMFNVLAYILQLFNAE